MPVWAAVRTCITGPSILVYAEGWPTVTVSVCESYPSLAYVSTSLSPSYTNVLEAVTPSGHSTVYCLRTGTVMRGILTPGRNDVVADTTSTQRKRAYSG